MSHKPRSQRVGQGLNSAVVWMLLVVSTAAVAAPDTQDCAQGFLQELGWRFIPSNEAVVEIQPGTPCDRADLLEAQAAGDLVVRVPHRLDATARSQLTETLLHHPATLCAYGFELGAATRRAVDRLVENRGFRFSALQIGWIGFGPTSSARDGWEPIAWFGRGYQPRGANSRAIEAFYTGQVRGECGLGRQIAQYATQAELYGSKGFDTEFDADEIVIGTFNRLHPSRSILLGTSAGRFTRDGHAIAAAAAGRQAFMGLPGFIFHVFDRSTLDDLNNQAENFVVYDVGAEAAAALRSHGGFEFYNTRNRTIWLLARSISGRKPPRYFQRLLIERDPALRAGLSADARATVARLDAKFADPFYRDFEIYVHKQGVKPVGFHIARLLDRNPRTPFRIELALHNLHTTLYDRYVAYRLGACHQRPTRPIARSQYWQSAPGPEADILQP
ncbi:hypothetical protein J2X04_002182 [Lysobacter niabensis]|uniref:Uncharacterized protein n=1 Tax=Agrilutibacter niabensis TaxID=380628 RepID=A0ABU1VQN7_9GAMM|nr:hypothetical protein [Lysobacter niabensis]MDR7099801.1 hypothetical protein [Lysobacter niabensis]